VEMGNACAEKRAHTSAILGTLRNARSQVELDMWLGRGWRGRAGQAFELCELDVPGRNTADSSPQTAARHHRMTRPSRRSPLQELLADSGSEPGANASPLFKVLGSA